MSERRRPKEKPTRRDRNGNTRTKWKRRTGRDFGADYTEYTVKYGRTELEVWSWSDWRRGPKKKKKPYRWILKRDGEPIKDGWEDSALGAKVAVEEAADERGSQ